MFKRILQQFIFVEPNEGKSLSENGSRNSKALYLFIPLVGHRNHRHRHAVIICIVFCLQSKQMCQPLRCDVLAVKRETNLSFLRWGFLLKNSLCLQNFFRFFAFEKRNFWHSHFPIRVWFVVVKKRLCGTRRGISANLQRYKRCSFALIVAVFLGDANEAIFRLNETAKRLSFARTQSKRSNNAFAKS